MGTERTRIAGHPVIRFGDGERRLVIVPGLSDALQDGDPSRLTRLLLERYYMRAFAEEFDVYVVSRPRNLPEGVSTRDLAAGYVDVLGAVGTADVLGMSMGGLIVQYLGIDQPEELQNLVVALAGPTLSDRGRTLVSEWVEAATAGRWADVFLGTVESTYTSASKRAVYGALFKLPGIVRAPPHPDDFIRSAQACLDHDVTDELGGIETRTLVLGGEQDVLFDAEDLRQMAATLPNGESRIREGTGHGAFEERRREFTQATLGFLRQ
jgi:pimeloyl-ACP methyl ester carboxylesterase